MNGKKILLLFVSAIFIAGCGEKAKDKEIDVAPRITLIGPTEVFFNVDDIYVEYGYTATDVDGNDVTSLVRRDTSSLNMGKEGTYQISYVAVDRKGVKSDAVYRTVNVGDAFAPEITISGSNPLLVKLNGEFSQPAATAVAYDGTDLSDSIQVNAESVDTTRVGTYIVSYTVTDSSGVTGTAQLYVYVMESSSPRIIVEGVGAIADNPYPLQVQDTSADDAAVKSYLNKALPYFQAYDLEDGDISYKVTVSEDEVYNNLISALKNDTASEGTVYPLSLTVSDSEGNVPSPLPVFYVTAVTDTTPPVITFDWEQPMYTIEIDAWNDNTAAWNKLFQDLGVKITDNSWEDPTPLPFTPNTPIPGISEHNVDDIALRAALTMNGDRTKFLANYDYNNATAPLNYKKVVFSAKDEAGNPTSREITVYLTDTTAPEIIKSNITIPFGVSSITEAYQLQWRDNSGKESVCTGLDMAAIDNALTEGTFNVTFTASHSNNPSKTSTLTYPVRVGSPLLSASGGNWRNNNIFANAGGNYDFSAGSDYSVNFTPENTGGLSLRTPSGWIKDDSVPGGNNWYWASWTDDGSPNISALNMFDRKFIVCSGVRYSSAGKTCSAYMVGGFYKHDTTTWLYSMNMGIYQEVDLKLYNTVTYEFAGDLAHHIRSDDSDVPDTGGVRKLIFSVIAGTGKLGTESSVTFTENASIPGKQTSWPVDSMESLAGTDTSYNTWKTLSSNVTVSGGNVDKLKVSFQHLRKANKTPDYGSLLTNIRICPVKWKGKQNKTDPDSPVGYWSYNTSNGQVTWSES